MEFLRRMIETKSSRITELRNLIQQSEDIEEVKRYGAEIQSLEAEISDIRNEITAREAEPQFDPAMVTRATTEPTDMEVRTAFMEYVCRGTESELLERREIGTSGDLGVMIPQTVMQEIITDVSKVYGKLYSKVRKTNLKGGVKYPIGTFGATFRRITETTVSDYQKGGEITGYVEFSYNIGEIRLERTLLQSILSVPAFEAEFAKVVAEAYVEAMEKEIMNGSADNAQMEGILTEAVKVTSRIPSDHIISMSATEIADWQTWQKKLFAKIPLSMRSLSPEFVMSAGTWESNIVTLSDDNNRPVGTETYNPVTGAETCRFNGKEVTLVEPDILDDFDNATDEEFFAMYWVPEKAYAVNSNMEFMVVDWFDHESNSYKKKAIVINDGKILDPNYIWLIKKDA